MRAKGLIIPKEGNKYPDPEENIPWKPVWLIGKWFINLCIAIPFVGAAAQCASRIL